MHYLPTRNFYIDMSFLVFVFQPLLKSFIFAGKILASLVNGLTTSNNTVRQSYANAIGHLVMVCCVEFIYFSTKVYHIFTKLFYERLKSTEQFISNFGSCTILFFTIYIRISCSEIYLALSYAVIYC